MSALISTEGYIPFLAESDKPCQTYYKKFTTDEGGRGEGKGRVGPAVIIVHGGPAFGHDYLLPLQELAQAGDGVGCVIFYDQIGCGRSTHLPEKKGDASFWNLGLLQRELANLIQRLDDIAPESQGQYHLLGHSVGALAAALFVGGGNEPSGLQRLVLANGLASFKLFNESNLQILDRYPAHVRDSIVETEEYALGRRSKCSVSNDDYIAALNEYRKDYCVRTAPPPPQGFVKSLENMQNAMDSFLTFAGGPIEMIWAGTLKDEDSIPILRRISVPTLVLNGEWDKASEMCSRPFYDLIADSQCVVLKYTSHLPQYEDPEGFVKAIVDFLPSSKK